MNMPDEAARPLQKMFLAVPPSYDFLNRLLTLRMDQLWRRRAASKMLQEPVGHILDLCTGTGDLAIMLNRLAAHPVKIHALDYSTTMLEAAKKKIFRQKQNQITLVQGDAASMPFEDGHFDAVGIAFAFRNLTFKNPDRDRFLAEIRRVLKPGGRFIAVETSQPENRWVRGLFHAYMRFVTKPLGGWLSGHRGAYHYLAHSAIHYHKAPEMKQILLESGFSKVIYKPMLFGMAALWECHA